MGRARGVLALGLVVAVGASCIGATPRPPSSGYGDPYRGNGQALFVKDSRGDWDIKEGDKPISSEKALEATGDKEYEARRQIAKDYNDRLYREGHRHRKRGHVMMGAGLIAAGVGLVLQLVVVKSLRSETSTMQTATAPETRDNSASGVATGVSGLGISLAVVGGVGVLYGYFGGKQPPPYHRWHTPEALNRPAYIRQQTEPYNEKLGVSSIPDELGGSLGPRRPGGPPMPRAQPPRPTPRTPSNGTTPAPPLRQPLPPPSGKKKMLGFRGGR